MATLKMPNPSSGTPPISEVEHTGTVAIVGANGSGKTRLGAWLENPRALQPNRGNLGQTARTAYRIAAQRVLSLPDRAERVEAQQASDNLVKGSSGPASDFSRIQGDPVTGQSNDFTLLLNSLFAERAKLDRDYAERGRATGGNPGMAPDPTILRLQRLWETVFSERRIVIGDHLVQAKPVGAGAAYPASALSDGERVGFYLIGHALLAPKNSRVVIDEPELHLHESIQAAIWDVIEAERKDCTFVYITHDLGFAATRTTAAKVVLFDYESPSAPDSAGVWKWNVVPRNSEIPEDVVLRILGSRRRTLFVEGLTGGLDHALYEALLPDRFIVPSGGWEVVDRSVRAFRDQHGLHHLVVAGIIDRDDRGPAEVAALAAKGVFALPVAAAENLLVSMPSLEAVAALAIANPADRSSKVADAKSQVVTAMKAVAGHTIAERAQHAVRRRLGAVSRQGDTKADLVQATADATAAADAATAFDDAEAAVNGALQAPTIDEAYEGVLKLFRNKSILHEAAGALGLTAESYTEKLLRALSAENSALRTQLRGTLPTGI